MWDFHNPLVKLIKNVTCHQIQCSVGLSALSYVRGGKNDVDACNTSLNIAAAWVWWCRVVTLFLSTRSNHSPKMRKSRDNVELMILFSLSTQLCRELLHCSNPEQLTSSLQWAHGITSVCGVLHGSHLKPLGVTICAVGHTHTHTPIRVHTHTQKHVHKKTTSLGAV